MALRLRKTERCAKKRGVKQEYQRLGEIALQSKAVFNRHLGSLHSWLFNQSPLYFCFHQQIKQGRPLEETHWDTQRTAVDSALNPVFYEHLNIAVLSPDGRGMDYYGPYTIVLSDDLIVHRTSVFEKNPFYFFKDKKVVLGQPPPKGYRATWDDRSKLVMAKLEPQLTSGMSDADLCETVLEPRGAEPDCDFIEVHIYGPVHRDVILSVRGPRPKDEESAVIWDQVMRKLRQVGAHVEELT